jgi:uncharacterized phosphosugar-binding protein
MSARMAIVAWWSVVLAAVSATAADKPTAPSVEARSSAAAGVAIAGTAEYYIDAQLSVVQGLNENVDSIVRAADAAARGLLAGGQLYLAGERGMVAELLGRAGGPCGAKAIDFTKPLPDFQPNDVILFSDYGMPAKAVEHGWEKLVAGKAMVVAFASAKNPILNPPPKNVWPVPVAIPCDSRVLRTASGERLIPTAPPAIAIAQWTFTAELIGACRRKNRQLAIYLSIFLDKGLQRLKRTTGVMFDPDLRPASVPREQYAREFLGKVRTSLEAIRTGQIDKLHTAAVWLREASVAKHKIVRNFMGHLPPIEAGMPGDVDLFTAMVSSTGPEGAKWIRENLHAGDVYFFLGYQQNEDAMAAAANAQGARTIFLTSRPAGVERAADARHLYINPHWPVTDGCIELPGYDVKACPLSCILGLTCYYAICGEAINNW